MRPKKGKRKVQWWGWHPKWTIKLQVQTQKPKHKNIQNLAFH